MKHSRIQKYIYILIKVQFNLLPKEIHKFDFTHQYVEVDHMNRFRIGLKTYSISSAKLKNRLYFKISRNIKIKIML